eukprot:16133396-Heterocapsa_arctica.AAC.1
MQNERNSLESFKTGRSAKEEDKVVPGTKLVICRWLLHRRKSNKKVKARIIAQHIKWCNDGLDTFAATSMSVEACMLIALMAERNRRGEN